MASPTPSRIFASSICWSCRQRLLPSTHRSFCTTSHLRADGPPNPTDNALSALSSSIARGPRQRPSTSNSPSNRTSYLASLDGTDGSDDVESIFTEQYSRNLNAAATSTKPHRLHVYATKHNTHITFVQPPRPAAQTMSSGISGANTSAAAQNKMVDVLLSLSTGNIGFRKAGRGSYDAAYQLAAFAVKKMRDEGMLPRGPEIEVVLRGFGAGREAVTKVLLGSEGRFVRGKIRSVVDATRLKLGGPRSKKPRRLG